MKRNCSIGLLIFLISSSFTESEAKQESSYFRVGIFEHVRLGDPSRDSPFLIINKNLHYYYQATKLAKEKDADMIIFPEYGLFPLLTRKEMKHYLETIPNPTKGVSNPCNEENEFSDRFIIRYLSCLAMDYEIVVVANIGDIQPCQSDDTKCPEDGTYHYNANIVFDRKGNVLSRYWKEYLFFEDGMDLPQKGQTPIFSTDFGTFGHFVCFDSLFKHSADLGKRKDVDAVLLSTRWYNSLPVYNSVQFWMAWALGNNATFITANAQLPGTGTAGSGVFSGNLGAIKYTFNPEGSSKLLVSRVPKSKSRAFPFPNPDSDITIITATGPKQYDEDSVNFDTYLPEKCLTRMLGAPKNKNTEYRCHEEKLENYTFVKLSKPNDCLKVCNNGMCCSVEYSMETTMETFFLGVLNGTSIGKKNKNYYEWCTENCIITRCEADGGRECGVIPSYSTTKFHSLQLSANFSTNTIYPSVVRTGMRLAPMTEWSFILTPGKDGTYQASVNFNSSSDSKALLIAAFNARCFNRDPPNVS